MNMPGYTAEASLTPASTPYRTIAAGAAQVSSVVPQSLRHCIIACRCCEIFGWESCCYYCAI
jgi:hypothetical protein